MTRIVIGGGCEWLLCGKCNGLAADVRVGDIQTTDMPDVVRACTCPDRPKKFQLEKADMKVTRTPGSVTFTNDGDTPEERRIIAEHKADVARQWGDAVLNKFHTEKPMTDFDAKLAELEANSDRVPELKMVVELLRMLRDEIAEPAYVPGPGGPAQKRQGYQWPEYDARLGIAGDKSRSLAMCSDPSHTTMMAGSEGGMAGASRVVCATCRLPKAAANVAKD